MKALSPRFRSTTDGFGVVVLPLNAHIGVSKETGRSSGRTTSVAVAVCSVAVMWTGVAVQGGETMRNAIEWCVTRVLLSLSAVTSGGLLKVQMRTMMASVRNIPLIKDNTGMRKSQRRTWRRWVM